MSPHFTLVPQVFVPKYPGDPDPEKYYEFFKQFDYFHQEIVFLNQDLVDKVTPETFDLDEEYGDGEYYSYRPHETCPEETIEKWGSRGVKFENLFSWLNGKPERFERFFKYVTNKEKLSGTVTYIPEKYRKIVEETVFTREDIIKYCYRPTTMGIPINEVAKHRLDEYRAISPEWNVYRRIGHLSSQVEYLVKDGFKPSELKDFVDEMKSIIKEAKTYIAESNDKKSWLANLKYSIERIRNHVEIPEEH